MSKPVIYRIPGKVRRISGLDFKRDRVVGKALNPELLNPDLINKFSVCNSCLRDYSFAPNGADSYVQVLKSGEWSADELVSAITDSGHIPLDRLLTNIDLLSGYDVVQAYARLFDVAEIICEQMVERLSDKSFIPSQMAEFVGGVWELQSKRIKVIDEKLLKRAKESSSEAEAEGRSPAAIITHLKSSLFQQISAFDVFLNSIVLGPQNEDISFFITLFNASEKPLSPGLSLRLPHTKHEIFNLFLSETLGWRDDRVKWDGDQAVLQIPINYDESWKDRIPRIEWPPDTVNDIAIQTYLGLLGWDLTVEVIQPDLITIRISFGESLIYKNEALEAWAREYTPGIRKIIENACLHIAMGEEPETRILNSGWKGLGQIAFYGLNTHATSIVVYAEALKESVYYDDTDYFLPDAMSGIKIVGELLKPFEQSPERQDDFIAGLRETERFDNVKSFKMTLEAMAELGHPEHLERWQAFF